MTVEQTENYRAREIVADDKLQTLLNSLTLDQIRTALVNLAAGKKLSIKSHKDAFNVLLQTNRSTGEIHKTLLEVETEIPFKHCVFVRLIGAEIAEKVESLDTNGEMPKSNFNLRMVFIRKFSSCISITFEHAVKVREWRETSPGHRAISTNLTRHPIVVRLYPTQGIAAFFFPGFSQGNATEKAALIGYDELVSDVMSSLEKQIGITFSPLPTRECIKVFVEGANARVRVVRSDVDALSGRVSLTSSYQDKAVEDVLADFYGDHIDEETKQKLTIAARKALGTANANSVVLFWFQEKIVTRLRFWDIGTEMLFIWHGVPSSYRLVEEIVGLFETTYKLLSKEEKPYSTVEWISKVEPGRVIYPTEFAEHFHLLAQQAREELLQAMKIGLLQPVYRLRTNELLIETQNGWTPDLRSLNKTFHTDHGGQIDGANPKSIEVAFLRVDVGSL